MSGICSYFLHFFPTSSFTPLSFSNCILAAFVCIFAPVHRKYISSARTKVSTLMGK